MASSTCSGIHRSQNTTHEGQAWVASHEKLAAAMQELSVSALVQQILIQIRLWKEIARLHLAPFSCVLKKHMRSEATHEARATLKMLKTISSTASLKAASPCVEESTDSVTIDSVRKWLAVMPEV